MNPISLKIISLPIHCKIGSNDQALKSGKDNGDFFSIIQKLMNPVQKKSYTMPAKTARVGLSPNKGDFYLESLRKALLGKGKPLNKISLNSNDLPLLKKFLCQCGFSQVNAGNLLKELLENNPCGEINLSEFFNKITELGPPKKRIYQPITLEPSAIPSIESALRDFGLTPKELEHVLASARVKGGGLDLNKFAIKLKGISHKGMPLQNKVKLEQFVTAIEEVVARSAGFKDLTSENQGKPVHNLAHQISKKLEGIGIQIPDKKKGEEQITIRLAKQSQLPTDVKVTVDRILEKAVIANEKDGPQSPLFSFSKPELTDLHFKEKLSKKGKKVEKESLLSPSKEKGGISAKNGQQKVESSFSSKEAKLFSDLDAGKARPPRLSESDGGLGFNRETIEEGSVVKSETRIMDIPQNISSSAFSESINTVKQNLEPVRDFLPSYLIDQVGKQISRSILRGEKVIRLQLKPPELGTLRVDMDMKDNILKLGMITENNSAKELLLSNIHELREALLEQGIKLDRLDVQINYNFNQSLANSKEGQNQDRNWMPFMAEGGTEDPLSGARNMAASDRLLDLVA
jgi:hypothetical protein